MQQKQTQKDERGKKVSWATRMKSESSGQGAGGWGLGLDWRPKQIFTVGRLQCLWQSLWPNSPLLVHPTHLYLSLHLHSQTALDPRSLLYNTTLLLWSVSPCVWALHTSVRVCVCVSICIWHANTIQRCICCVVKKVILNITFSPTASLFSACYSLYNHHLSRVVWGGWSKQR